MRVKTASQFWTHFASCFANCEVQIVNINKNDNKCLQYAPELAVNHKEIGKIQEEYQKSHICKEGGTQLRVSVRHLLMNLKTTINYSLKKLLKWANKKCKTFNIYNSNLKKGKHLGISLFYTWVPKTWWCDLQFLRYRVWQTEIGNYGSFFALLHPPPPKKKMQKIKILKNEKSIYRCHPFTHVYQKSQYMIMMYASWDIVWHIFSPFWVIFALLPH